MDSRDLSANLTQAVWCMAKSSLCCLCRSLAVACDLVKCNKIVVSHTKCCCPHSLARSWPPAWQLQFQGADPGSPSRSAHRMD